jgi:hypothetical protein
VWLQKGGVADRKIVGECDGRDGVPPTDNPNVSAFLGNRNLSASVKSRMGPRRKLVIHDLEEEVIHGLLDGLVFIQDEQEIVAPSSEIRGIVPLQPGDDLLLHIIVNLSDLRRAVGGEAVSPWTKRREMARSSRASCGWWHHSSEPLLPSQATQPPSWLCSA